MYMSLNLDPNNWKVASRKSEAKRCEDHFKRALSIKGVKDLRVLRGCRQLGFSLLIGCWGLPLRVIVYRVFWAFSGLRCRLQVLFAFGDVPGRSGRAYVSDSCAETAPQEKKNKCTKTLGNHLAE